MGRFASTRMLQEVHNFIAFWNKKIACQDRELKFLASLCFRILWNLTKFQLSSLTNKKFLFLKMLQELYNFIAIELQLSCRFSSTKDLIDDKM